LGRLHRPLHPPLLNGHLARLENLLTTDFNRERTRIDANRPDYTNTKRTGGDVPQIV
jgi:hypothetical protein